MMMWWDKIGLTVDIVWLVFAVLIVVAGIALVIRDEMQAREEDEGEMPLNEYERCMENMEAERRGWKAINDELRERNDELQREKVALMLDRDRARLQLVKLKQDRSVSTVEDFQRDTEALHLRLIDYVSQQDEILSAYTTGNLFIENTEKQQKKVEALGKAEACLGDAIVYLANAKTTGDGQK